MIYFKRQGEKGKRNEAQSKQTPLKRYPRHYRDQVFILSPCQREMIVRLTLFLLNTSSLGFNECAFYGRLLKRLDFK